MKKSDILREARDNCLAMTTEDIFADAGKWAYMCIAARQAVENLGKGVLKEGALQDLKEGIRSNIVAAIECFYTFEDYLESKDIDSDMMSFEAIQQMRYDFLTNMINKYTEVGE